MKTISPQFQKHVANESMRASKNKSSVLVSHFTMNHLIQALDNQDIKLISDYEYDEGIITILLLQLKVASITGKAYEFTCD